jgi:hypothetical protein
MKLIFNRLNERDQVKFFDFKRQKIVHSHESIWFPITMLDTHFLSL